MDYSNSYINIKYYVKNDTEVLEMDKKNVKIDRDRKSIMLDTKTHKILKDRADNNGRTIKGEIKWILGIRKKALIENDSGGEQT
ncbi:hypothetical protein LCGC14_0618900 [marine sediment metagenome]|uniref:Uncharacterized protein n=1 Tax=marine sediment metagenome TaxID=412755 RepID=A0A0F9R5G4_9ZZZZ